MAEKTLKHLPQQEREQMCVHAAGDIESIGRMLRDQQHEDYFDLLLNGALIRIAALSSDLLSLTGQDFERSWPEVHEIVFGEPMEAAVD